MHRPPATIPGCKARTAIAIMTAAGAVFSGKLQAAVTTALQAAKSSGTSDPNQVIQDAIESVVKGNPPPDGPPSNADASDDNVQSTTGATLPNSTSPDGTSPDASRASTPDASTNAPIDPATARQAFFQTLQSYGVDAQQFHQDFRSALQDARSGLSDLGQHVQKHSHRLGDRHHRMRLGMISHGGFEALLIMLIAVQSFASFR